MAVSIKLAFKSQFIARTSHRDGYALRPSKSSLALFIGKEFITGPLNTSKQGASYVNRGNTDSRDIIKIMNNKLERHVATGKRKCMGRSVALEPDGSKSPPAPHGPPAALRAHGAHFSACRRGNAS